MLENAKVAVVNGAGKVVEGAKKNKVAIIATVIVAATIGTAVYLMRKPQVVAQVAEAVAETVEQVAEEAVETTEE